MSRFNAQSVDSPLIRHLPCERYYTQILPLDKPMVFSWAPSKIVLTPDYNFPIALSLKLVEETTSVMAPGASRRTTTTAMPKNANGRMDRQRIPLRADSRCRRRHRLSLSVYGILRRITRIIAQACRAVQQENAKKSGAATAPDVQNARKRINL